MSLTEYYLDVWVNVDPVRLLRRVYRLEIDLVAKAGKAVCVFNQHPDTAVFIERWAFYQNPHESALLQKYGFFIIVI